MGTKILHQIKKWSLLVPLTTLFMLLSVMSYGQETQTVYNPVVTTDKLDYAPEETVYITGSGWHAGEEVSLLVMNLTYPELNFLPHYEEWFVKADEDGNFEAWWDVTEDELGTELVLTALGQTSGYKEQVFFTDAVNTETTLTTSGTPSTYGSSVTFTTGVTRTTTGNTNKVIGTLNIEIDGNQVASFNITEGENTELSYTTSSLSAGEHTVIAYFIGEEGPGNSG